MKEIPDTYCCGWCHMPIKSRYKLDAGKINGVVESGVFTCDSCGAETSVMKLTSAKPGE